MEFEELHPARVEVFAEASFTHHGPDTHDGIVLGSLVSDVLAVGGAVGLVPFGPRGVVKPWAAAYLGREYLLLLDVSVLPIDFASDVEPGLTVWHGKPP